MCGRFVLQGSAEELANQFHLVEPVELAPRYNIAPTQDLAVVRAGPAKGRELAFQRWGLIPSWAKDRSVGQRMINARCETVAEKPAFRRAFRERRCIVPASAFYEWGGKAGDRTPYLFSSASSPLFGFAGLWESWKDPDGHRLESCTVITTEANSAVRPVHHRMPVILDPRDYGLWLEPKAKASEDLVPLLVPCPPDWLEVHEVSRAVNDARFDDPSCVAPVA